MQFCGTGILYSSGALTFTILGIGNLIRRRIGPVGAIAAQGLTETAYLLLLAGLLFDLLDQNRATVDWFLLCVAIVVSLLGWALMFYGVSVTIRWGIASMRVSAFPRFTRFRNVFKNLRISRI